MTKYVRIENGKIAEIFAALPVLHPDLMAQVRADASAEAEAGWAFDGLRYTLPVKPDGVETLYAYAANKRWHLETSGITVDGLAIRTDRESQGLIAGAQLYTASSGQTIRWKGADGRFSDLDAQAIATIGAAVARHVQACFAAEAAIVERIAAGQIKTPEEIDDWQGWPVL